MDAPSKPNEPRGGRTTGRAGGAAPWKRTLGGLAAALTGVAALLLPAAAPAQAASPCSSDNPPDWCYGDPDPVGNDPTGTLSSAVRSPGGITVSGVAADADGGPVSVRIRVGGTVVGTLVADRTGPSGAANAFSGFLSVPDATGTVCATAVNIGSGSDADLGCSTLSVGHNPFGSMDTFRAVGSSILVEGWAIDPDTTGPVQVRIEYDGNTYGPYTANVSRPDVGSAYPGYGDNHGYSITFTPPRIVGPCNFAVSVISTNVGAGADADTGGIFCS